jgi:hypothetical protein
MGKAGPPSPGVQQPPFSATSVLQTQPGGSGRGVAAAGGFCGVSSAAAAAPGSASAKASAKAATVGARSGAARGMAGFEVDGGEAAPALTGCISPAEGGLRHAVVYAMNCSLHSRCCSGAHKDSGGAARGAEAGCSSPFVCIPRFTSD